MNPSESQMDTNKPTNENWTQRYVDYDKEDPQPRDISNDYIKEEMVGNVRGVFIKTRNLEPNEIENRSGVENDNWNVNIEKESSDVDKNKVEDKNLSLGMGNNMVNDKSSMNFKTETSTFNSGNVGSLNRPNEGFSNAGNVGSINRGNEGSLNRPSEGSLNRPNEMQSLNPRNETATWNAGTDNSTKLNEMPSLNQRNETVPRNVGSDTSNRLNEILSLNSRNTTSTDINTNRILDTNQNINKTNVAGSSPFNLAQK
jgi:hypothetical protein